MINILVSLYSTLKHKVSLFSPNTKVSFSFGYLLVVITTKQDFNDKLSYFISFSKTVTVV